MPPPATPAAVHPCLRTHGKEVARLHLFDWAVLLLLVATTGALGLLQPFHRFLAQDMMVDLQYPMKGSTVPDWAVPKYNNVTGDVICHGKPGVIKEGYKSFPSGHASGAFAGLGFLSWYLAGKVKAFDRRGHIGKLCIVLLPPLLATMVAVSRVTDYWHHWQDVFAGGLLGLVVASFCYLQFFPPPYSEHGVWPHAYLEHIRRSEGEMQSQSTTNSNMKHNSLPLDLSGSNETRTTSHALDSMEEGSRDH